MTVSTMSNVDVEMSMSVFVDMSMDMNGRQMTHQVIMYAWSQKQMQKAFLSVQEQAYSVTALQIAFKTCHQKHSNNLRYNHSSPS